MNNTTIGFSEAVRAFAREDFEHEMSLKKGIFRRTSPRGHLSIFDQPATLDQVLGNLQVTFDKSNYVPLATQTVKDSLNELKAP